MKWLTDVQVSPGTAKLLLFITTLCQGVTGGTVHMTNLIPDGWVPYATAWLNLFVFVNLTFLTIFVGPNVVSLGKPPGSPPH